ncbi:MAG: iron ABC transporter permease [Tissierellia bacterium]|nr:iron ABC transporter permease [Tissierellia bacterium]
MNSIKLMNKEKKTLDIMNSLLKIFTALLVIVFVLYPFLSVFGKALYSDGRTNLSEFQFIKGEFYLVKNSLLSASITALLSTTFALALGLMTFFVSERQKKIIMFILLLTMVSPPFIGSLTYIELFGRNGFITRDILKLSINPYGLWGIVSVQTLGFTSLNAVLLIGYLDSFDKTMIESAKSLKANTTSILLDIVVPLMKPAIAVSFLLSFIRSMADFSSPMIIGGAFNTLATEAYLSIIAKGNSPRASAMSVILFIPSIIVFIVYSHFLKQQQSASKNLRESQTRMKKSGVYHLVKILGLFFILWLIIQYLAIFTSAFTDKYKGEIYFTFDNIKDSIPHIRDSFIRSIIYSIIAGVFSSLIGLILSFYSYIMKGKYMKILDFISNMPYIVPGTFFGLGYIFAFNKSPLKLTGTALIVILNLIFRQLPMSIRTIQSSMTQIERATLNSAKDLGAHNLYILKDMVFPMSYSGLFLSFTNAFISSMTTIGSIIFLVYPSRKLATFVLFDLVSSGKYKIASVLSCIIIIVCLSVSLLSYRIFNRSSKNVS